MIKTLSESSCQLSVYSGLTDNSPFRNSVRPASTCRITNFPTVIRPMRWNVRPVYPHCSYWSDKTNRLISSSYYSKCTEVAGTDSGSQPESCGDSVGSFQRLTVDWALVRSVLLQLWQLYKNCPESHWSSAQRAPQFFSLFLIILKLDISLSYLLSYSVVTTLSL